MNKKRALITGITGQDGSYLAELLLKKGYEVYGIIRRSSSFNTGRIDRIFSQLKLFYGDTTDSTNIIALIQKIQPYEIYHLAAQSHVSVSFETPEYTANADAVGTLRLLEAIRLSGIEKEVKFYQASSSEMFGKVQETPQTETTPFYPRSPYGTAKCYAYWITVNYREAYNLHASNGILFNHCSPRRGNTFASQKIIQYVKRIEEVTGTLKLGNLEAKRDFGWAPEYVEAMWLMLQQDKPDDYVVATNECHSIREFCEVAFKEIEIDLIWQGSGVNEKGMDGASGATLIEINEKYFRPAEVDILRGDYSKIKKTMGWEPKIRFKEIIRRMLV